MRKRPEQTERTKEEIKQAFWKLYASACEAVFAPSVANVSRASGATSRKNAQNKNPLDCITVQQVADCAGYTRGTFYLHFNDLYDVLEQIENRLLDGMTACVTDVMQSLQHDCSKSAKVAALGRVIVFYERNKRYISVLLGQQGGQSAFVIRLKEALKPLWRQYVLADAPLTKNRQEAEVNLLLEYTLSGTLYMIAKWLAEPSGVSAAQMGHLIYDLAIQEPPLRN